MGWWALLVTLCLSPEKLKRCSLLTAFKNAFARESPSAVTDLL